MFAEFQLLTNCKSASDASRREREKKGEETTSCAAGQIPNAATTSMNGDTTQTERAERGAGVDAVDNIISTGEWQIVLKDINGI